MSYIGNVPTTAAFPFSQFSGNGSTTAFTLISAPAGSTAILVYVAGVVQNPNVYSVVSNTLTFNVAPAVGTNNIGVLYLGIPAYTTALGSFTSAQLAAALTDETGTGLAVFNTSPTLVTPILGAASATSVTFPDASTQNTGATGFGFKNRIINGDMRIDQRNAGASVSITAGPFTLDRWAAQTSTGGSVQQITSTITGFANSFKYTASASNAYLQMGQQIEYLNCYDLQNVTVSISFWAKANNSNAGSTALVVRTRTAAAINGAARFAGANVDTSVTITTSAVQYTVTRTLPATFGALSLEFVFGANVSGDGFEITGVQLEKGSTATSFDYRDYGRELIMCQRYYEVGSGRLNIYSALGSNYPLGVMSGTGFQVAKRSVPTVTLGSATANGCYANSGGTENITTAAFSQTVLSLTAGSATYCYITQPWTASIEL